MSGAVKIDPSRMRAAAPKFQETARHLSDAAAALASSLNSEGECWGADEAGQDFAKGYVPNIDSAMTAMGDMCKAIAAVTDKLNATADSFRDTDGGFGQQLDGQL